MAKPSSNARQQELLDLRFRPARPGSAGKWRRVCDIGESHALVLPDQPKSGTANSGRQTRWTSASSTPAVSTFAVAGSMVMGRPTV